MLTRTLPNYGSKCLLTYMMRKLKIFCKSKELKVSKIQKSSKLLFDSTKLLQQEPVDIDEKKTLRKIVKIRN